MKVASDPSKTARRTPISVAVAATVITVATLVLGTFGGVGYLSESDRRFGELRRDLDVRADQLAVSLALPAWNIDRAQIDRVIEGLNGTPEVAGVVVDVAGKRDALVRNGEWRLVHSDSSAAPELTADRNIFFQGEKIGTVRLTATTRFVRQQLRAFLISMIVTILAVDLLLTLIIYLVLWRAVVRPLVEIEKYALGVSSEGLRAGIHARSGSTRELENVRQSIQTMVKLLEKRYGELQDEVAGRSESEARFRSIFDSVNDGIIINDMESGAILDVNRTMGQMFGYTDEELRHLDVAALSSGRASLARDEALVRMARAADGEAQLFEWHVKHRDGHHFWTEVNLHVATLGGSRRAIVVVRDITQRKQMEDALRAEKELIDTAINTMTGLFFVQNRQGRNVRWNRTLGELLPQTEEERSALPDLALIHPDDREQVAAARQEVFEGGVYREMEVRLNSAEPRYFILNGRRIVVDAEPFVVGTGLEITERKRAEAEQLRLQNEVARAAAEWQKTFDTVRAPIVMTDETGVIVRVNQAALDLSNLAEDQITGMPVEQVGSGEPWQTAAQLVNYIVDEGLGTATETRDSEGRSWEITVEHFSMPQERSKRFILLLWEITGIVELQESLRRSETMSAMGTLVAGVAHEVRNPLFGISATLDAYDDELGRPEYLELRATLRREVGRLVHLMQELLEYGKPSAPSIALGDVADVVREALASRQQAARLARVELRDLMKRAAPPLLMDGSRLRQVFENVIDNAIQHSEPGGIVQISDDLVELAGRRWIELRVEDAGPGFSGEDLGRVFEPFFTRRDGGTGLGLSIVQRIVQEHSGRVSAANRPEGGGMITMLLPLADS